MIKLFLDTQSIVATRLQVFKQAKNNKKKILNHPAVTFEVCV